MQFQFPFLLVELLYSDIVLEGVHVEGQCRGQLRRVPNLSIECVTVKEK